MSSVPRSVAEAVALAADVLARAGCETARLDASVLFRHAAGGWDEARLIASGRDEVALGVAARFDELVARRAAREPVAYLVGEREFWSRTFRVDPRVLVPRPETEDVLAAALRAVGERLRPGRILRIVDVGTGSGILAVTLAAELGSTGANGRQAGAESRRRSATSADASATTSEETRIAIVAVDLSGDALAVARENACLLVGDGAGNRVPIAWIRADLTTSLATASADIVVANPPYVTSDELARAAPELAHEPLLALEGGDDDGLGVLRRLLREAARVLIPGGVLVSEIGSRQGAKVASLASSSGFEAVEVGRDLAGRDRFLVARRGADGILRGRDPGLGRDEFREESEVPRGEDGWTRSSFEEGARSRARFGSEAPRTPLSRSSSHRF